MITESVKTILGADLSNQVEAALKGKGKDGKDVDLVVGNDGTFVPADKYNGANSGKTSAENALKAAAEALKAIGGSGDPAFASHDHTLKNDYLTNTGPTSEYYYGLAVGDKVVLLRNQGGQSFLVLGRV